MPLLFCLPVNVELYYWPWQSNQMVTAGLVCTEESIPGDYSRSQDIAIHRLFLLKKVIDSRLRWSVRLVTAASLIVY